MLACSTCAMGVRRYCCASPDCTHARFFCQSCKSKACSSCGLKATEQWITEQQHILPDCDWQHITFTMPHLLWPFFNNNWPLLNDLFRCATRAMLRWARQQGIDVGIFCALHCSGTHLLTPAQSASSHPRVCHPRRPRHQTEHLAAAVLQKERGRANLAQRRGLPATRQLRANQPRRPAGSRPYP
ncbi:Uncharacterised protein [Serratia marcescens]|nr:Uncharacterised protein [Serratia marcescens]CAB5698461.1 Uncharacterised protein [Serratia marcescens]